ncbi:MAG TPA: hypothetical protein VJT49_13945 [Amycolatopsis sp.]|uniref:hypothetical protein n=1 Tax=Amycolatopsis sp. TaxID=37632 RepID=UPI002B47CC45|nr:hypothetical protein [Amycolatopsis sp.]HKS46185.1 hypothetical protein [Amycolatopsis sp.]
MASAAQGPHIVFTGPPDALEAIVPVHPAGRKAMRVVARQEREQPAAVTARVLTAPVGTEATLVRLVLSPTTPPGRYEVTVAAGDAEFAAVVDVTPQEGAIVQPATPTFVCPLGETARTAVTILNTGNTSITPRLAYAVGLLEDGAVEDAIGVGLSLRARASGESRFELVGDALADRYGGRARLRITGLDGPIAPGDIAQAVVELSLDDRAQAGRSYHGSWLFEGSTVPVSVVTPPGTPVDSRNGPSSKGTR